MEKVIYCKNELHEKFLVRIEHLFSFLKDEAFYTTSDMYPYDTSEPMRPLAFAPTVYGQHDARLGEQKKSGKAA